MRVLITGANGLLGQTLVPRLAAEDACEVLATARDDALRFEGNCAYARLDITDADRLRTLFADFAPDVVINCAAMTQVDQCEQEQATCWTVNAEAVETMASVCNEIGAQLVQLSTDFVFDGEDGPYAEDAPPNPINYYGHSKLASERAARTADSWAIVRTVLVYGTSQGASRSNIVVWLVRSLARGEPLQIVTDQHRTPTYVADLADGIARLVGRGKTGIYHLGGPEMMSVYELARRVAKVFDLDVDLVQPTDRTEFSQPAPRPLRTGFVIDKARRELDYDPRGLEEALHDLKQQLAVRRPEDGHSG